MAILVYIVCNHLKFYHKLLFLLHDVNISLFENSFLSYILYVGFQIISFYAYHNIILLSETLQIFRWAAPPFFTSSLNSHLYYNKRKKNTNNLVDLFRLELIKIIITVSGSFDVVVIHGTWVTCSISTIIKKKMLIVQNIFIFYFLHAHESF